MKSSLKILIGAGVLLVGALALWHLAEPLTAQKVVATPTGERVPASTAKSLVPTTTGPSNALPRPTSMPTPVEPSSLPPEQPVALALPTNPFLLRDLAAALAAIQDEPDADLREEQLHSLAERIATGDLPAAVNFVLGESGSDISRGLGLQLLRRWTENDPRTAATWVSQSAMESGRQDAINAVAIVWANQDRGAAIAWVQQLPTEAERQGGLLTVAYEAARTEPLEALHLASTLPPGQAQDNLMTHAANQWAASAPAAAAAWAKGIPDAALRERTLMVIATAWGETSPRAAATLAMQSLTPGRHQDDAVVGIVQRWVQKEPEQAAAWVAAFPQREVRDAAVENLVRLWADQDMERAAQWLTSLEVGELRDVAIGTYASKLALQEPDAASHWVEKIEDQVIREREMIAVGEAWMGHDEAAARAWILHSSLPDSAKERLFALYAE